MILVIAAMEEEYQELEKFLHHKQAAESFGIKYHLGELENKEVMLLLSGVGKVNAARALTTIMNNFAIDFIINIGSAGGIVNEHQVKPLDIVFAKKVCYHDVDLTLANRLPGVLPGLPQYFETALNEKLLAGLNELALTYHYATIASGDQFVCELDKVAYITKTFIDVCAVDMEAAAIAHLCYLKEIPFIVLRSISDVINEKSDNQMQFEEYIKQASHNSALAAKKIIELL